MVTVAETRERQRKWDLRFLDMARLVATWSKDPSTKCGAVICDPNYRVVSVGFNGYPSGVPDDNSLHIREEKYLKVIHGEINSILFARRDLFGCTIFVYPLPPCSQCMASIIQSGISRVVTVEPSISLKERWGASNKIAQEMAENAGVIFSVIELI